MRASCCRPTAPALRVQPGDRIGLVGRNGAGKTTTMRILAGEAEPYAGSITRAGEIGYLPQDPKEGDLDVLARDRVLSARGLDMLLTDLEKQQALMAEVADDDARDRAVRRYGQLEERFVALGGYGAESEAGRICASLGLPDRVLTQQLRTLSGGQRRRVELSRILFAASDTGAGSGTTLLLDEPTNHLDADSLGWLRDFLRAHTGGLVVISHNVDLLADVVNRVWFLDAVRGEVDVYNMGWQKYLDARATDEQRRRRERANAETQGRRAAHAGRQAGRQGHQSRCGTEHVASGRPDDRRARRGAGRRQGRPDQVPDSCRVRAHAAGGQGADQDLRLARGVHRRRSGDRPRFARRRARAQRRGQDHAAAVAGRRRDTPTPERSNPDTVCKIGYFAQEHDTLDSDATVWENIRHAAPDTGEQDLRGLLGAFMFSGPQLDQPAGTLSGGEKTRLALAGLVASTANVLLLDEPTNNLDPASREQVLDALRSYQGAVVLVTHDPGAAEALRSAARGAVARRHRGLLVRGVPGSHRARLSKNVGLARIFVRSSPLPASDSYARRVSCTGGKSTTTRASVVARTAQRLVRIYSQLAARVGNDAAQPRWTQSPRPARAGASVTPLRILVPSFAVALRSGPRIVAAHRVLH